ncbi:MAG: thioredoxin domain-containing protein [Bacteroidetes bacterium]|nr:thioredoxin domain-containing protein [Bacteroidota bacterium]
MNKLHLASSPYLRQHADNPVHWQIWGKTTLELAKKQDKPILLSVGYSTCHWCHVMARESFQDPEIADYMNAHFVNIKVDREERPDLDNLYMDACQAISGSSGWPLNIFLTPDLKPYFGGTYFPPEAATKKLSWFQALQYAFYNFKENRQAVENQADKILRRIKTGNTSGDHQAEADALYQTLIKSFDPQNGGFGSGMKFPNTMALEFMLEYAALRDDKDAFNKLAFTVSRMLRGGIYDQIGSGIARYTTDPAWRIPHFEKMGYDNALFLQLLARMYKYTNKRKYKTAFTEVIDFLEREMRSPEGTFYAAMDAESDGKEGAFYTWTMKEIREVLGKDAALFSEFYNIQEEGNSPLGNILHQPHDLFAFAERHGIEREALRQKLKENRETLLRHRQQSGKKPPPIDKKIILSWNALMVSAYVHLYQASGEQTYADKAEKLLACLQASFRKGSDWHRFLIDDTPSGKAGLRDLAYLIRATIDVYQLTFDTRLLLNAEQLSNEVLHHFTDPETELLCMVPAAQTDVLYAPLDLRDEDMPSGNIVMARNLQELSLYLGRSGFRRKAEKILGHLHQLAEKNPLDYASVCSAVLAGEKGIPEICIIGPEAKEQAKEIGRAFIPFSILLASEDATEPLAMLEGREAADTTEIYLCQHFACQKPEEDTGAFLVRHSYRFKHNLERFKRTDSD